MDVCVLTHTHNPQQVVYRKADVFISTTSPASQVVSSALEITKLLKGRVRGQQTTIIAQIPKQSCATILA